MHPTTSLAADLLAECGPFDGEVPDPDGAPWDELALPRTDRRITHLIAATRDADVVLWTPKIRTAAWSRPRTRSGATLTRSTPRRP